MVYLFIYLWDLFDSGALDKYLIRKLPGQCKFWDNRSGNQLFSWFLSVHVYVLYLPWIKRLI